MKMVYEIVISEFNLDINIYIKIVYGIKKNAILKII